jgi:pSer/pThr/pTyr-binding forkhead associated (FHA) protein
MADSKQQQNKSFSPDWLVRGVLTKLGDTFDRFTGRSWKPSSSLATSELIERLKKLMDSEVRDEGKDGKFVPHRIKLKMQWDKFSTDAQESITKLETELLTAAIDHINDNLYHTYAPIRLEIKPDYFTEGVKLLASFDEFAEEPHEAELNVTVPDIKTAGLLIPDAVPPEQAEIMTDETYEALFTTSAGQKRTTLVFTGSRRLSVGRTGTNDLVINDTSVSKIHASLFLNSESGLMVADTGSTNGTFVNGERISYGKAYAVADGAIARFGTVDVVFDHIEKPPDETGDEQVEEDPDATIAIGEFEFKRKVSDLELQNTGPIEEGSGESSRGTVEPVADGETVSEPRDAPAVGVDGPAEDAGPEILEKEKDTQ